MNHKYNDDRAWLRHHGWTPVDPTSDLDEWWHDPYTDWLYSTNEALHILATQHLRALDDRDRGAA